MFDVHPALWVCLYMIANSPSTPTSQPSGGGGGGGGGLISCAPIVRSLLTVLTQYWQRCYVESTATFTQELQSSISLVECMAKVSWKRVTQTPPTIECSRLHGSGSPKLPP